LQLEKKEEARNALNSSNLAVNGLESSKPHLMKQQNNAVLGKKKTDMPRVPLAKQTGTGIV